MWCNYCGKPVVNCECSDIEERLELLVKEGTFAGIFRNALEARRKKRLYGTFDVIEGISKPKEVIK
jgi:hypothetical protein